MTRAQRRLVLLQKELDSQLLRVKEREQELQALQHRQQEMADSSLYRETQALPEPTPEQLAGPMTVLPEPPMQVQHLTPEEAAEMRERLGKVLGR